jgi:MFS family permease
LNKEQTLNLIAVLIAFFSVPATISGIGTLGPDIGASFDIALVEIQWIFTIFLLCSAGLTVPAGTLAMDLGKFRVFGAGALLIGAASVLSALSSNYATLLIARGIAGCGAAALLATGPPILAAMTTGAARNRAFSWFGTAIGAGLALGPLLAATISTAFGWYAVFWGQAALFLTAGVLMASISKADATPSTPRKFHAIDAVVYFLALVGFFYLVIEGPSAGLGDLTVRIAGSVAALGFAQILITRWRRPSRTHLLSAPFWAWTVSAVFPSFSFFVFLLYMPTYLFVVQGVATVSIGWIMTALTIPMVIFPMVTSPLLNRGVRASTIFSVSALLILAGMVGFLTTVTPEAPRCIVVMLGLIGAGTGMLFSLTDAQALSEVGDSEVTRAASLINTMRLGSEAAASAAFGSVLWLSAMQWAKHAQTDANQLAGDVGVSRMLSQLLAGALKVPSELNALAAEAFHAAFSDTIAVMLLISGITVAATYALWLVGAVRDKQRHSIHDKTDSVVTK